MSELALDDHELRKLSLEDRVIKLEQIFKNSTPAAEPTPMAAATPMAEAMDAETTATATKEWDSQLRVPLADWKAQPYA